MALVKGNNIKIDSLEVPPEETFNADDVINNGGDPFVFDEEFDKEDVVNKIEKESKPTKNSEDAFFSKEDLEFMTKNNPEAAAAATLAGLMLNEEADQSGVIKKEDIRSGKVKIQNFNDTQDSDDFGLDTSNDEDFMFSLDDEDLLDFNNADSDDTGDQDQGNAPYGAKTAEILVPETPVSEQTKEFKRPEEELQDFLRQNFKDFIKAPVISNNLRRSIDHTRIPGENVRKINKTVEISDKINNDVHTSHTSHVVLNRSEDGELESIEVVCKCGERTLIKFDYFDELQDDGKLTEFVDDIKDLIPFSELKHEIEPVTIVDPELVIKSARFYDDDNEIVEDDENELFTDDEDDDYEDDDEFTWNMDTDKHTDPEDDD